MSKELVEKPEKQSIHKTRNPSVVQPQRPLTPPPVHHQVTSSQDAHEAAQSSWESILGNRDTVARRAMGGGRPFIQTKLTLGPAGDKYEQEADSVAQQVVSNLNSAPAQATQRQEEDDMMAKRIQREGMEDEMMTKRIQRAGEEDEMMTKRIQRAGEEDEMMTKSTGDTLAGGPVSETLENEIQGARGGGQPIADNVRGSMEQAFNADFSNVRVHADSQSHNLNQSVQARAFTTGQDIFFRQGEYNPGSSSGQELLAHELTHVVQQNGSSVQRDENQSDS